MLDDTPQAPQGQPEPQVTAPATPAAEPKTEAPLENKFAGKNPEELAKSYSELEKKLGDQSNELGEHRKYKEQMDAVLQAIWSDQDIYNRVDQQIRKIQGGTPAPETTQPSADTFAIDDTRAAMERKIINDFETQFGIDKMETDKRKEAHGKVGQALRDLVDPNGRKTTGEILKSISLEKLPSFLENAYFLANKDNFLQDEARKREAQGAMIGSIPSSGGLSSSLDLSPLERETAKKMGVTEDKYRDRKKQLLEERKSE